MTSDQAECRRTELERKLAHILDRRMRLVVVREALLASASDEACAWISAALDRAPGSEGASDPLREAIVDVLSSATTACMAGDPEPIPYALRRDLYAAAVSTGADRLAALLRSHPDGNAPETAASPLPRDMKEIPLGVRRSLAKGDDRVMLEKLALDPDPLVVANLLRNPRLRESEVVRIAALRTVPASTLETIAATERWSTRLAVRTALARNPHCPVALAIRLIGALPLATLRTLQSDPGLPDATMSQIETELDRRRDGSAA
jgi:hypothetical protein